MPPDVKLFAKKAAAILTPAVVVVTFYILLDPFKVVQRYENYFPTGSVGYTTLNNDFVATQTFLNHYSDRHYDSFIFGNSRSRFYEADDWLKHIAPATVFHFDGSNESLFGIHGKVRFLDERQVRIRNALIVVDATTLAQTKNSEGHLFIKAPEISNESRIRFQIESFKAFLHPKFIAASGYFALTGKMPRGFVAEFLNSIPIEYEVGTNEYRFSHFEAIIASNPADYYKPLEALFRRKSKLAAAVSDTPVIGPKQREMLEDIHCILMNQRSAYRIVISPLYDQVGLNSADVRYLEQLFGKERVWNFSGVNEITRNPENYYELSHYRPHVARMIMDAIYKTP